MKKSFLPKSRWLVTIILLLSLGISQMWGDDAVKKTYDTNSSTFATGYGRKAGDNFVWWGQKGFFGANNATNHSKALPTAADLPVVKAQNSSATTTTTGLYYLYTSEAVANVCKVEIYLSAKSGSSTVNAYIVSSSTAASSGSATWSKVTLSSSSSKKQGDNIASANTYTYTFNATETSAKYYGVVFSTSSYWRATNLTFKLYTPTYTVTYNANGGSGTLTDSSSPYMQGATVTVKSNSFTRSGYTFDHWDTKSDDSGTDYSPSSTFAISANTTLYAQWAVAATTVSLTKAASTNGSFF